MDYIEKLFAYDKAAVVEFNFHFVIIFPLG